MVMNALALYVNLIYFPFTLTFERDKCQELPGTVVNHSRGPYSSVSGYAYVPSHNLESCDIFPMNFEKTFS